MAFLLITEDGELSQQKIRPSSEDCQAVDDGSLTIIRFNSNLMSFERAVVVELEGDEDADPEYEIDEWQTI